MKTMFQFVAAGTFHVGRVAFAARAYIFDKCKTDEKRERKEKRVILLFAYISRSHLDSDRSARIN